jgi:hypothetical protein
MGSTRIGTALLGLIGLGIAYVGISYLVDPVGVAPSFVGSTTPDPAQFLGNAKGVRDLVTGIGVGILLVARQRRAAGWFALVAALIPIGDMLVVLNRGGSVVIALAVHGATALVVVVAGVLLLRSSSPAAAPAPAPAAAEPVAS